MMFEGKYTVYTAKTGLEAKDVLAKEKPDVVLLDIILPDINGLCLLGQIKKTNPKTEVIMLTASEDREAHDRALHLGACDVLTKPVSARDLRTKIQTAIESGKSGGSRCSLNTVQAGDED